MLRFRLGDEQARIDSAAISRVHDVFLQSGLDKGTIIKYGPPAIINSDQGSQFTSNEYKGLLKELQIRQSMDGKSRWADNIMIERWFRSLKTEEIYLNEYHSPRELRQALERYVTDYNSVRPHEAIGYKTPDEVFASCFPPRSLNDDPAAALDRTCLAG